MTERESIAAYIESQAAKFRAQADQQVDGWEHGRAHAALLDALASDIRAELDVCDQVPLAA